MWDDKPTYSRDKKHLLNFVVNILMHSNNSLKFDEEIGYLNMNDLDTLLSRYLNKDIIKLTAHNGHIEIKLLSGADIDLIKLILPLDNSGEMDKKDLLREINRIINEDIFSDTDELKGVLLSIKSFVHPNFIQSKLGLENYSSFLNAWQNVYKNRERSGYVFDSGFFKHKPFIDKCGNIFLNKSDLNFVLKNKMLFYHEAMHVEFKMNSIFKVLKGLLGDKEFINGFRDLIKETDQDAYNFGEFGEFGEESPSNIIDSLKPYNKRDKYEELVIDLTNIYHLKEKVKYTKMLERFLPINSLRKKIISQWINILKNSTINAEDNVEITNILFSSAFDNMSIVKYLCEMIIGVTGQYSSCHKIKSEKDLLANLKYTDKEALSIYALLKNFINFKLLFNDVQKGKATIKKFSDNGILQIKKDMNKYFSEKSTEVNE